MVDKSPIRVKIADSGHSKRAVDGQTEPRSGAGTYGYMAPEVLQLLDNNREDSAYTSAVDVWSLGCLLYYILTKQIPFGRLHSLIDFSEGRTTFPEGPLRENRVSSSGRAFISGLIERLPESRPKASVGIMNGWIIPPKNGELPDSEIVDTSTTTDTFALNQRRPSLGDTEWSNLLGNTTLGGMDLDSDEMVSANSQHPLQPEGLLVT